jgi:hypothetical protein
MSSTCPWLTVKPAVPSVWDDEFESFELDAKWTRQVIAPALGFESVARIDPFILASGLHHIESLNRHRPSWLMVQPINGNNTLHGYDQIGVTLPNEAFFYARVSTSSRLATTSDGDGEVGFRLYNTSVGTSDYIQVFLDSSALTRSCMMARAVGGVFTIMGLARNYSGEAQPIEYLGLQKIGTTFHGWCATASGNWMWLGTHTLATAMYDRIHLLALNSLSSAPGRMIVGFDFFRVLENFRGPP